MKKTILTVILLLFCLSTFAGGGKYEQKMAETLQKMANCQGPDDFRAVGNQFLLIAKAEKKEWLPYYYHAYVQVILSFMSEEGAEKKDLILDEAEESINMVLDLGKKEAEAHALNAFFLIARLSVDPASRGQQYSMLTQVALGKALGIDPANPRARYLKLSNDMGTARFFGKPVDKYCGEAQALLASWDEFEPASLIHPSWGKNQVQEILDSCKSE